MTESDGLVEIHLLDLPVPLAARARQHFEELTREFALMQSRQREDPDHQVPRELLALVATLTERFAGAATDAERRLDDAIEQGVDVLADHVLVLPPAAGPASAALDTMIDRADDYCRGGDHLLTLATPPDCVAYRRWYLGEVVGQLSGRPPVPWSART